MPKKGFTTITIPKDVHRRLKKVAEKEYTSVPRLIEKLLAEHGRIVKVTAQ